MSACRVTVNGRTVEVPAGTLVTDAARVAEVHVPIFCSHDKLPPLGACRICVVEVGMPRLGPDRKPVLGADGTPEIAWMPKVQTGCTTTVMDGMHVRTESATAVKARKGVMEFLLVNHPLDCPVCDEGGECQLQDLAFAFGHDFSRMDEAKRTFDSEDLGPVVKKEANRCIVCMRCVRYCDEVMGDDALTAHQRGVWTEISSFNRQPLECEQCGNCVEVCPVGALTALPYRFKARPWDLRQHITICPYCSNGCSVRLGVRGNEVLRARGSEFRGINREYLCVRGRFGYEFVNSGERLTAPLLRLGNALSPAGYDEAVTFAAARPKQIAAVNGPGSVAFLGGEKLNVEEAYLFQKLARAVIGSPHVDARTRFTARVPGAALLKATGGGRPILSFDDLYRAEEVLILGEDLQGEAPFAQAQLIRGQHQQKLHLTIAHPRQVKLARTKFGGDWLAMKPGSERALIDGLTRAALDAGDPQALPPEVQSGLAALKHSLAGATAAASEEATGVPAAAITAAAKRLREASRKAILFGRALAEHPQAPALLQAVENLAWVTGAITSERSAVMYLGPQNDTQGALVMGVTPDCLPGYVPVADAAGARRTSRHGRGARHGRRDERARDSRQRRRSHQGAVDRGRPLAQERTRSRAGRAGARPGRARDRERAVPHRDRTARARRLPGQRLRREGGRGGEQRAQAPEVGARPRLAQGLQARLGDPPGGGAGARRPLELPQRRGHLPRDREAGARLPRHELGDHAPLGPQWSVSSHLVPASLGAGLAADKAPASNGDGLWLLSGGTLFLQGSLSQRGELLPKLAKQARAFLNPEEARRLGVADGEMIELASAAGTVRVAGAVDAGVPAGSVFVPYAYAAVELNRLGMPAGAGLKVRASRVAAPQAAGVGN